MHHLLTRTPLRVGAALLGGSVLAVAVPALAAVSASSPPAGVAISIVGTGKLVANGAEAKVPFTITCPAGSSSYLQSTLSEAVGKGVASNSTYLDNVPCNNVPQKVTLIFQPQSGGKAFAAGAAAVTATFQDYSRKGSVTLKVDGKVKLK